MRTKLISKLNDIVKKLEDVCAAGGSAGSADGKKSVLSSEGFLTMAGIFIENITLAKDLQSKMDYACDFRNEVKALIHEKQQRQEKRRKMKQLIEEKVANKEKLPAELTKKGHAKQMATKENLQIELRKLFKKRDKYNKLEVDFSLPEDQLDDSKYIRMHAIDKRILFLQKKIHEIDGVSEMLLPRPLSRKFKFNSSTFADIDSAVSDFMTNRLRTRVFDAPDATDISSLIKERRPQMPAAELTELCTAVFTAVCRELKERRYAETMDVLHGYESDEDQAEFVQPEENDAELQAKLQLNDTKKVDETQVFEEYEQKWLNMTLDEQAKQLAEEASGSEKDPDEEGDDDEDSEEEIRMSDDSSDDDETADDGDEGRNEENDLEPEPKPEAVAAPADTESGAVPTTNESSDETVEAEIPVVTNSPVQTETNGASQKRPAPLIKADDFQAITIDDDSDDDDQQPAKKMRLDEPELSKTSASASDNVSHNGTRPVVDMDWKPAATVVDLVDLSSDED